MTLDEKIDQHANDFYDMPNAANKYFEGDEMECQSGQSGNSMSAPSCKICSWIEDVPIIRSRRWSHELGEGML